RCVRFSCNARHDQFLELVRKSSRLVPLPPLRRRGGPFHPARSNRTAAAFAAPSVLTNGCSSIGRFRRRLTVFSRQTELTDLGMLPPFYSSPRCAHYAARDRRWVSRRG